VLPRLTAPLTVETDRARYAPGETVTVTIRVPDTARRGRGALRVRFVRPLDGRTVHEARAPLPGVGKPALLRWKAPTPDFTGYRIDVDVLDGAGKPVASGGGAVDVSSDWKRFPRYGFVSRFDTGVDPARVAAELNRFHINGLQFYDWQWQHHRPYSPEETWPDIANRPVSRRTVTDLIGAAHARGMTAMSYNLIAGAYAGYEQDGSGVRREWGLFRKPGAEDQDRHEGLPASWAAQTLYLFDPASPDWQRYHFARQRDVFTHFAFDGYHVDSLGNRGKLFTADGKPVDLAATFTPYLNAAKRQLKTRVVFNCVSAYGLEAVARGADVDFLYAELWDDPGLRTYADIASLTERVRGWTKKPIVYAAYLNRRYAETTPGGTRRAFNPASVLLADAVIFASGAAHIELGDAAEMLATEYFPNRNLRLTDTLKADLVRYYDFAVAYQNLLRDPGVRADPRLNVVSGGGGTAAPPLSTDGRPGAVWALPRRHPKGAAVVHLINLTAIPSPDWRDNDATYPDPPVLKDVRLRVYGLPPGAPRRRVWCASPDAADGRPVALAATPGRDAGGAYLAVTVPRLHRWTMLWTTP